MATFYIDYENVHYSGTAGVDLLGNGEYVYLFYSPNANTMNMETVKHFVDSRCGLEFIEADTGTPNALDFQLVTFLYSGIDQDDYHYIISKDRGFDASVKMGIRMGIENVKRFPTIMEAYRHYEKHLQKIEEIAALEKDEKEVKEAAEETVKETAGEAIEEVAEEVSVTVEQNDSDNSSDVVAEKVNVCQIDEVKYRKMLIEKIKRIVQKEADTTLSREELEISCDGINNCDNKLTLYHFLRKKLGDKRGRSIYTAINEEFMELKMELAV